MPYSFYLENIPERAKENPRQFLKPTAAELDNLKVGDPVRLFFIFNFKTADGCHAERMWIEISEIDNDNFKGSLTNQPVYIKDIQVGDEVEFTRDNIATIIVKPKFDETKKAIITKKALHKRQINWVMRSKLNNPQDSGWRFFHGDEDQDYLDDPNNSTIVTLESVLQFEPKLENVLPSNGSAFDWDDESGEFVENKQYSKSWWQFWKQ